MLNSCDCFSTLTKDELLELKNYIQKHDITYKDSIGIPESIKFGIEIENIGLGEEDLNKLVCKKFPDWYTSEERFLKHIPGAEVSSPIFHDDLASWENIKDMCEFLKQNGLSVGLNMAGHINFGNIGLINYSPIKLVNIMKMWAVYEPVIYRFSKGEFNILRPQATEKMAKPIAKEIQKIILNGNMFRENINFPFELIVNLFFLKRHVGLNLENLYTYNKLTSIYPSNDYEQYNRIEVRTPNGTLNPVIWQNNINFFSKLFVYATGDNFNASKIDQMLKQLSFDVEVDNKELKNKTYEAYEEINIPLALDLADLIFDNNLDKINFLKQYIGFENLEYKEKTLEKKLF